MRRKRNTRATQAEEGARLDPCCVVRTPFPYMERLTYARRRVKFLRALFWGASGGLRWFRVSWYSTAEPEASGYLGGGLFGQLPGLVDGVLREPECRTRYGHGSRDRTL